MARLLPRSVCRGGLSKLRLAVGWINGCETRHVSGTPAIHGSVANLAFDIAPLLERQASRRQLIFSLAIGTFEDRHLCTIPPVARWQSEKYWRRCLGFRSERMDHSKISCLFQSWAEILRSKVLPVSLLPTAGWLTVTAGWCSYAARA